MKSPTLLLVVSATVMISASALAQSSAPAGATALCRDNTYYTGTAHRGACGRHGGVQQWLAGNAVETGTDTMTPTAASAPAQPPGETPVGATARCRDNTYSTGTSHRGACARHGGVQEWLAPGSGETGQEAKQTTAAPGRSGTTTTRAAPPYQPQYQTQYQRGPASPSMTPVSSGEGDRVWVNTASKVYHCPNDPWYGKTSKGQYMSQSQARAQGFRPDHNRPCPV